MVVVVVVVVRATQVQAALLVTPHAANLVMSVVLAQKRAVPVFTVVSDTLSPVVVWVPTVASGLGRHLLVLALHHAAG